MPAVNSASCIEVVKGPVSFQLLYGRVVSPLMSHPHSHGGGVTLLDTPTSRSLMQGAAGAYRLLLLIIMLVSVWQLVPDLEPLVMSEQHDLDLRNWICSSTLSFHYSAYLILVVQHQQSFPLRRFWSFSFPENDVTPPSKPNWHYSTGQDWRTHTVHLRIHFTSFGTKPGSYTVTQLCGKLLTVVRHYAQWDCGKKKKSGL